VATDRSVLYVVTDGAASDGGTDGDPLAVQSEQLASIGVEVHVIGVGDRVRPCVICFNIGRLGPVGEWDPTLLLSYPRTISNYHLKRPSSKFNGRAPSPHGEASMHRQPRSKFRVCVLSWLSQSVVLPRPDLPFDLCLQLQYCLAQMAFFCFGRIIVKPRSTHSHSDHFLAQKVGC
jgi:hypothetical protein